MHKTYNSYFSSKNEIKPLEEFVMAQIYKLQAIVEKKTDAAMKFFHVCKCAKSNAYIPENGHRNWVRKTYLGLL